METVYIYILQQVIETCRPTGDINVFTKNSLIHFFKFPITMSFVIYHFLYKFFMFKNHLAKASATYVIIYVVFV